MFNEGDEEENTETFKTKALPHRCRGHDICCTGTPKTWRINWWSLCCLTFRKKESMFRCWFHLISSFPDDRDRLSRLFPAAFWAQDLPFGVTWAPFRKAMEPHLVFFSIFGKSKLWSCQTVNWCNLQFSWCSRDLRRVSFLWISKERDQQVTSSPQREREDFWDLHRRLGELLSWSQHCWWQD